jgi:glycosyltransferase involved in cell wall biosynthesis
VSKSPISAVVVSRNEGELLADCLRSLSFCDELVVYDLESTDDTVAVAIQNDAKVLSHKVVPVVEELRMEAIRSCKHPWVLFLDPDERISPQLAVELDRFVKNEDGKCAVVLAPWIFYFKQKKLKGTMWGTEKYRPVLFCRPRVTLSGDVHLGTKINPGYIECKVGDFQDSNITHYWSNSFSTLVSKHRRYLTKEGSAKYNNGERYPGRGRHVRRAATAFYSCYIYYRGYRNGFNGLLLSLFWSWYTFASLASLRRYEKSIKTS